MLPEQVLPHLRDTHFDVHLPSHVKWVNKEKKGSEWYQVAEDRLQEVRKILEEVAEEE
jgi:hypothetical protein